MPRLIRFFPILIFPLSLFAQVTISSSANPSILGQPVVLTATLATNPHGGSVTFFDGFTSLGVAAINSQGQAALSVLTLPAGKRSLRASFSGSLGFAQAWSAPLQQIVIARPAGTFLPPLTLPVGINPNSVVQGDFNGDGRVDLAVANSGSGTISILTGNGDGTFQPWSTFSAGAGAVPSSLAAADFDGDNRLDLAVALYPQSALIVFRNIGGGNFLRFTNTPLPVAGSGGADYPYAVQSADINGDGRPDLITSNNSSTSVWLGNGDGTFQNGTNIAGNFYNYDFAIADFNNDGKADLVITRSLAGGPALLLGNGDGTFSQTDLPASSGMIFGCSR